MFDFSLTRLAMAAAAVVVLASPAAAQTSTAPSPSPTAGSTARAQVAREDMAFLKQAAQNGHAEIEGSKLAETKAANDKVKSFAKQMIDDHTKTSAELSALAASKGVEVSAEPSVAQKAKIKALGTADGAKFDTRYVNELGVKAHEDTVKLFEKAANGAKDPEVKAWAAKTLPALKQHLSHAKELKAAVADGKS